MNKLVWLFLGIILLSGIGCPRSPQGTYLPPPTVRSVQNHYGSHSSTARQVPWKSARDLGEPSGPAAWIPPSSLEDISRWKGIVVHHSATPSGNAAEFNKAHLQRGWDGLGYDFVINNGRGAPDGKVEVGYRWRRQEEGAHCRPAGCEDNYWNEHTIGICLVGDFESRPPTSEQWRSLLTLVRFLQNRYHIPDHCIIGHRDVPLAKTKCPGKFLSLTRLRYEVASQ